MKKIIKNNILLILCIALCVVCVMEPDTIAFASEAALQEVKNQINIFVELLTAVVSGIGAGVTIWAFMKLGMAMQASQGGMEAQSFSAIVGGIIIILAPQLVKIFVM